MLPYQVWSPMSLASNPSQQLLKAVPLTPIRSLLCKLNFTRPKRALGKRNRKSSETSSGAASPTTSLPTLPALGKGDLMSSSPVPEERPERARLALQNEDIAVNAVVITTLPIYPFCCHEDLIMMSRQQLVDVAGALNSHLPAALKIEVSDDLSQAQIRHSIETLVGIIPETPAAPKAVRSWPKKRTPDLKESQRPALVLGDREILHRHSASISPLAMRISRRRNLESLNDSPVTRRLEPLDETDEGFLLTAKRPLKKRKVSQDLYTPTRFTYAGSDIVSSSPINGENLPLSPMDEDALDTGQEALFSSPTERQSRVLRQHPRHPYVNRNASPPTQYRRQSAFNLKAGAGDGARMDVI